MRITVLAGGVGGARFLRSLRWLGHDHELTAVVNTGDDAWIAGLYLSPDLDSIMYTLAGENDEQRGWGRVGETERVSAELTQYGVGWPWFTLGDLDLATLIARTSWLRDGLSLSEATDRLTARWELGATLVPATDDEYTTHVLLEDGESLHFQEWWVRYRAQRAAVGFEQRGAAAPSPGALQALADADVVLLAPSNPVVSTGAILGIPGMREALLAVTAPIVGVSPVIGGAVVRGMADACLEVIGVATAADAIALHYGARSAGGLLDGWLVDSADAASVPALEAAGIRAAALPLLMKDEPTSRAIAAAALELATH